MLRDRRTIISTIVVPTVVIPLILLGFGVFSFRTISQARAQPARVMVIGDPSREIESSLQQLATIEIVPAAGNFAELIVARKIRAAVDVSVGFEAALQRGQKAAVRIYHHEGDLQSGLAAAELEKRLRDLREQKVQRALTERELPATFVRPFEIVRQNVAPPEKIGGATLGGLIPYLLILLSFTGAMYPAIDLTAGEKERGTLEALLSTPIARVDLVLGKFFAVLIASLATVVFSLLAFGLTAVAGALWWTSYLAMHPALGEELAASAGAAQGFAVSPGGVVMVFLLVIPIAVLFSGVLLAVALCARSYKEAQTYVSPLVFVAMIPSFAALVPGLELSRGAMFVPILNVALVSRQLVSGEFPAAAIATIVVSSCAYAWAALAFAVCMFKRENVIFRT